MVRWLRAAALGALMVTAQGCGGTPERDAGKTVQALLAATASGDAKAFEEAIDRPALRADLRQQMIGVARANGLDVGGPSDFALDRMIGPQAIKLSPPGAPSLAQLTPVLKSTGKDRVCLHDLTPQQACLLTFAHEPGGWRLVSMPAGDVVVAIPPAPVKK
ncbi:hypothetical protein [Phenylobacterium sp.]|uniref:hypothetical protein n=1 Tax=Phenylobacterium sp. TaxID=1871053 RepID=UPI002DF3A2E5|nr:hypothetical protein [Phenylobacterium sp.]